MKQLELRSYPRAEIAEVLSVNINDSRHFKRNVENKLTKWGYGFHYSTLAVEILTKPETPEERLAEILYRGYGIDIQIFPEQFAYFIAAFTDIEGFNSMPWGERAAAYYDYYGIYVSEKTLRNWCSQLIARGVIVKVGGSTKWRTYFEGNRKIREPIDEIDEVEMQNYFERRSELFKEYNKSFLDSGMSPKEARMVAWKNAYQALWAEYSCCYYYCKDFSLSAFSFNEIDTREIYELVAEIAAAAPPRTEPSPPAPTTEFVF